jgi:DNA-binding MarR family transcriptional regulator
MDFFKALFELLGSSRRWVVAIFLGCAGFLTPSLIGRFGANPTWDIHWCAVGLLFLTGGFLATVVLEQIYTWLRATLRWSRSTFIDLRPMSDVELAFLQFLGEEHATTSYDIDEMRGNELVTKLETVHAVEKLMRRGLVKTNRIHTTVVALTPKGRRYALELIAVSKKEADVRSETP